MDFNAIVNLAAWAALCYLGAYVFKAYRSFILKIAEDLINKAEETVEGSNMGAEKKARVIAQLEAIGIRVDKWLSKQIDNIVYTLNVNGAWLAKKTQEAIKEGLDKAGIGGVQE